MTFQFSTQCQTIHVDNLGWKNSCLFALIILILFVFMSARHQNPTSHHIISLRLFHSIVLCNFKFHVQFTREASWIILTEDFMRLVLYMFYNMHPFFDYFTQLYIAEPTIETGSLKLTAKILRKHVLLMLYNMPAFLEYISFVYF